MSVGSFFLKAINIMWWWPVLGVALAVMDQCLCGKYFSERYSEVYLVSVDPYVESTL
jgi:hypothetical protein